MATVTIHSDFGTQEIKFVTISIFSPSVYHEVMGPDAMIIPFDCWVLSQFFHSPLPPSSRSSLVPVHFLSQSVTNCIFEVVGISHSNLDSSLWFIQQCRRPNFNVRDLGSISGLGRSSGNGKTYLLQYACLDNSMDRGTWGATVHGVTKSWTWLSDWRMTKCICINMI